MSKPTSIRPPQHQSAARYEDDLYGWVQEQVAMLRAKLVSDIDAANIAEELASVGNELREKLESAIAVLTLHLLKWDHQANLRSRSWALSVREHRRRIDRLLKRNPGLKSVLDEAIVEGYADGRDRALLETGLEDDALPEACPYTFAEMMTRLIVWDRK